MNSSFLASMLFSLALSFTLTAQADTPSAPTKGLFFTPPPLKGSDLKISAPELTQAEKIQRLELSMAEVEKLLSELRALQEQLDYRPTQLGEWQNKLYMAQSGLDLATWNFKQPFYNEDTKQLTAPDSTEPTSLAGRLFHEHVGADLDKFMPQEKADKVSHARTKIREGQRKLDTLYQRQTSDPQKVLASIDQDIPKLPPHKTRHNQCFAFVSSDPVSGFNHERHWPTWETRHPADETRIQKELQFYTNNVQTYATMTRAEDFEGYYQARKQANIITDSPSTKSLEKKKFVSQVLSGLNGMKAQLQRLEEDLKSCFGNINPQHLQTIRSLQETINQQRVSAASLLPDDEHSAITNATDDATMNDLVSSLNRAVNAATASATQPQDIRLGDATRTQQLTTTDANPQQGSAIERLKNRINTCNTNDGACSGLILQSLGHEGSR